jgi:iron-sulfur cluster assembly accessory protein
MNLIVTESASEKLATIVSERPEPGLDVRLYAEEGSGGGCACSSGMRFGMAFDNAAATDARVTAGGLEFIVDPTAAQVLEGASIDWVDNVMNQGFAITAPNSPKAAGGCGCGANEAHAAPQAEAQAGGCGCGANEAHAAPQAEAQAGGCGGGCACGGH